MWPICNRASTTHTPKPTRSRLTARCCKAQEFESQKIIKAIRINLKIVETEIQTQIKPAAEINGQEKTAAKKNRGFIFVLAALVIGGGAFGSVKYIHGLHHEETDDAQIDADVSPVIARVSGYVKEVRVRDNQFVKKGDTLVMLDDRDLAIKVKQAENALHAAQVNRGVAEAQAGTIEAQIEAAKINLWRANQDFERYANLAKERSITQQEFEQATASKQMAERQLEILAKQKAAASSQTRLVTSQSGAIAKQINVANAGISQRQTDLEGAKLNQSYSVITAPEDGVLSKIFVQPGQYVAAGQSLFSVVLNTTPWVVANFKETQLGKMKAGQKVTVRADAYPGQKLAGEITSFAPATGSKFSLLPPDNASGNFVKVVQRLPVKIEFDNSKEEMLKQLRPGMNVTVDVHLD